MMATRSTRSTAARRSKTTRKKTGKKTGRRSSGGGGAYRILALDGGGIRGVMTAFWLAELEKRLGGRLADHVDLVAGTSTGSILASAICLRIPAADIVNLYRDRGRDIFPSTAERMWNRLGRTFSQGPSAPKYDDDGLERSLRDCLGEGLLGDLPASGPGLMITAYETITRHAEVFKSWSSEFAALPIWEAAKASSSAPTFFPAHVTDTLGVTMSLVDGGVAANNPAACAIAEAVRLNSGSAGIPIDRFALGSFGTGESARPISAAQAREWGAIEWAVPVISVLMDGAADTTSYVAGQFLGDERYVRINTRLDTGFDDMDDASSTNIEALVGLARRHVKSRAGREGFEKLARLFS